MTASLEQEIRSLEEIQGSEHDPEGRTFVHLADARRRSGELDEALALLEEGLERHPDFSSAHVVAGWVHRDRDEVDESEAAFRRVLELDEENTAALRGLGELAQKRGSVDAALGWFKRLAALVPEDRELADRVDDLEREQLAAEAGVFSELDGIMAGEGEASGEVDEFAGIDSVGDEAELGDILSMGDEGAGEELAEPEEPEPTLEMDEPAEELPGFDEPADEPAAFEAKPALEATSEAEDPGADLPEPAEEWEPEEGDDEEVFTETMGQLYARQGLLDRAVEVYEHLVDQRPDETHLQERLADLREKAAGGPAGAPPAGDGWSDAAEEDEETVEAIAREMSSGEGAAGTLDTPFAWEEDEEAAGVAAPDDESGGPVSDYFGRLLAWAPEGAEGLPEPAPTAGGEPVPIESLAPGDEAVPVESLAPDEEGAGGVATAAAPDEAPPSLTLDEDDEGPGPVVMIAESSGEAAGAVPIESLAPDSTVAHAPGQADHETDAVPIESLAPDDPSSPEGEGGAGGDDRDDDFGRWLDRLT